MRLARWLTYRLGFHPRPGSILYSPSREIRRAVAEYMRGIEEGLR